MTEQPEDTVEKLVAAVAEYARLKGGTNSTSSVVLNFGGWGVIAACAAAAISIVVMLNQNAAIARLQAEMIDKAQQAREERAALKESQETQQAYLNVLLQKKEPK